MSLDENQFHEELTTLKTAVSTLSSEIHQISSMLSDHDHKLTIQGTMLKEHDIILVRGNGKPSLQEDVRNLLEFAKSLKFWMTTIAIAFISQFIAVGVTLILAVIKLLPLLEKLYP